jgi:hypothetical protein
VKISTAVGEEMMLLLWTTERQRFKDVPNNVLPLLP